MSESLLVWKWSEDFDTPAKRKKLKIKFGDVTSAFIEAGDSPAFGDFDMDGFLDSVSELYPEPEEDRPFVVERYPRAICFSIPNQAAGELIPKLGRLAMQYSLNGAQC
jgi:hypothetical protein